MPWIHIAGWVARLEHANLQTTGYGWEPGLTGKYMHYFAYGSNMSLLRLRERVPSAERVGTYTLPGHELRWHKMGKDGSGKCDAFFTGASGAIVQGSVFEISADDKPGLDRAEGLGHGYEQKIVTVFDAYGRAVESITYYATRINASLEPFCWYLNHVLVGARQSSLTAAYLSRIEAIAGIEDTDRDRDQRERAIYR